MPGSCEEAFQKGCRALPASIYLHSSRAKPYKNELFFLLPMGCTFGDCAGDGGAREVQHSEFVMIVKSALPHAACSTYQAVSSDCCLAQHMKKVSVQRLP